MHLFYYFLIIYLLLKPYYIFASGSMQICDIFLALSFALFLIYNKKNIYSFDNLKEQINKNKYYLFFLILVLIIQSIYFITYTTTDFLIYLLYYIYDFLAIIVFGYAIKNEKFLSKMNIIIKLNLIIQLLIYALGYGRWYGLTRYMGTFNDPNQLAYFILLNYCFIYILNQKYNKNILPYLAISVFLIFESMSTGILLGISVFLILDVINIMRTLPSFIKRNSKKIMAAFFIILFVCSIGLAYSLYDANFLNKLQNSYLNIKIFDRVSEKVNKIDSKNGNLLQERGYDRIKYYPQYIIYGAGEGNFKRWQLAYHQQEFHATLPSILFNYGILSLFLVCMWIYNNIKKLPFKYIIVYIALLAESFTLVNSRQALFWVIFILGNYLYSVEGGKINNE